MLALLTGCIRCLHSRWLGVGFNRGSGKLEKTVSDPIAMFEENVWAGKHGDAIKSLATVLKLLNQTSELLTVVQQRAADEIFPGYLTQEVATRICAAVTELFSSPRFRLDERSFGRLISYHRWLHILFASSSFGNADHILRRLRLTGTREVLNRVDGADLLTFCFLFGPESRLTVDFTALFRRSPPLACCLGVALLSNRLVATPTAHSKREKLLKWLTEALDHLQSMDGLPLELLIDLYMHCSYADDIRKHDIKKSLNRLVRRRLELLGFTDPPSRPSYAPKKTIFVVLEWFQQRHSIMRTHSRSLLALRQHYHLVGLGASDMVDDVGRAAFDEYHEFPPLEASLGFVHGVLELVRKHNPAAVYYPSVGMAVYSLILINLRLAPVQCIALGHPATTHSDKIDYVLVEEDYIGDPSLFSERIVALPGNAVPYLEPKLEHPVAFVRKRGGPVRVAVPAALMKLNPRFLQTCRMVQERATLAVEFHIMAGGDFGFVHPYLEKCVLSQLPGARIHRTVPNEQYMHLVAACDVFANPFPFGNTNGTVDAVYCGLPGVCLSGDEVHSHIDEGMFRRMNFPEWTIARSPDEYIAALLKLIDDEPLRRDLRSRILSERWDRVLYEGRPESFADVFHMLVDTGVDYNIKQAPS